MDNCASFNGCEVKSMLTQAEMRVVFMRTETIRYESFKKEMAVKRAKALAMLE